MIPVVFSLNAGLLLEDRPGNARPSLLLGIVPHVVNEEPFSRRIQPYVAVKQQSQLPRCKCLPTTCPGAPVVVDEPHGDRHSLLRRGLNGRHRGTARKYEHSCMLSRQRMEPNLFVACPDLQESLLNTKICNQEAVPRFPN